jgi:signal transduction histidine kinase
MYEQPSIHWEIARQRHVQFAREAERARLAADVERQPSQALAFVKHVVETVHHALTPKRVEVRRPAVPSAA